MRFELSGASLAPIAAAFAVLASAGCTPADPCAAVTCGDLQICEAGVCVDDVSNLCLGKPPCPTGTGCDSTTGNCRNLCTGAAACTDGLGCKPETGKCVDLCTTNNVNCTNPAKACVPATGVCEDRCKADTCSPTQACDPLAAPAERCKTLCETATKPVGEAECGASQKCEPATGDCVSKCKGVQCPGATNSPNYAQHCNPASGRCETGKPPAGTVGAICSGDEACDQIPLGPGQEATCLTDIDGDGTAEFATGYCTATCSLSVPCPPGAFCLNGFGCLDKCLKKADCAEPGYDCLALDNFVQNAPAGEYVCFPGNKCGEENPADCRGIGADCEETDQCADGSFCYPEVGQTGEYTGFDGGYCIAFIRSTDACPVGSSPIPVSSQDPTQVACLKDCEFAAVGSCGLGEACQPINQEGDAICLFEECDVDAQCRTTTCTAAQLQGCGTGQACTNIAANGQGTCKTNAKCDTNTPCPNGAACGTDGECQPKYCDAALGLCLLPGCTAAAGATPDTCAELGSLCNPATSHCERACTRDAQCAGEQTGLANAVCSGTVAAPGLCIARCTEFNEEDVCGTTQVCNFVSGKCQAKCSENADCGDDSLCDVPSGRCSKKCNVAGAPECAADRFCNEAVGTCDVKCTLANELQICGADKLCQTWSGKCFADCETDAALCGAEACSVQVIDTVSGDTQGFCAPSCTTDAQCARDPSGHKLRCKADAPRHCEFTPCSETVPCAGTDVCVAERCRAAE